MVTLKKVVLNKPQLQTTTLKKPVLTQVTLASPSFKAVSLKPVSLQAPALKNVVLKQPLLGPSKQTPTTAVIDSVADVIRIPLAASAGDKWAQQVVSNTIGESPSTMKGLTSDNPLVRSLSLAPATLEAATRHIGGNYVKPLITGQGSIGTTLINELETLDILTNPIKGLFNDRDPLEGLYKGLIGKEEYQWDTGNKLADFALEVIVDPANLASFGTSSLVKGTGKAVSKKGAGIAVKAGLESVEAVAKNADEIIEASLKNQLDDFAETFTKSKKMQKIFTNPAFSPEEAIKRASDEAARGLSKISPYKPNRAFIEEQMMLGLKQEKSYKLLGFAKSAANVANTIDSGILRLALAGPTLGYSLLPKAARNGLKQTFQSTYFYRLGDNLFKRSKLPFEEILQYTSQGTTKNLQLPKNAWYRLGKATPADKNNITNVSSAISRIQKAMERRPEAHVFKDVQGFVDDVGTDQAVDYLYRKRNVLNVITFADNEKGVKVVNVKIYNKKSIEQAIQAGSYIVYKGDYLNIVKASQVVDIKDNTLTYWKEYIKLFKTLCLNNVSTALRNFVDGTLIKDTLSTGNIMETLAHGVEGAAIVNEFSEIAELILKRIGYREDILSEILDETGVPDFVLLLDRLYTGKRNTLSNYLTLDELNNYKFFKSKTYEEFINKFKEWSFFMTEGTGAMTDITFEAKHRLNEARTLNKLIFGSDNSGFTKYNNIHKDVLNNKKYLAYEQKRIEQEVVNSLKRQYANAKDIEPLINKTVSNVRKLKPSQAIFRYGSSLDISGALSKEVFMDAKVQYALGKYRDSYHLKNIINQPELFKVDADTYLKQIREGKTLEDEILRRKINLHNEIDQFQKALNYTAMDIINFKALRKQINDPNFLEKLGDQELENLKNISTQLFERLDVDRFLQNRLDNVNKQIDELSELLNNKTVSNEYLKDIDSLKYVKEHVNKALTSRDMVAKYLQKTVPIIDELEGTIKLGTSITSDSIHSLYKGKIKNLAEVYEGLLDYQALQDLAQDPVALEDAVRSVEQKLLGDVKSVKDLTSYINDRLRQNQFRDGKYSITDYVLNEMINHTGEKYMFNRLNTKHAKAALANPAQYAKTHSDVASILEHKFIGEMRFQFIRNIENELMSNKAFANSKRVLEDFKAGKISKGDPLYGILDSYIHIRVKEFNKNLTNRFNVSYMRNLLKDVIPATKFDNIIADNKDIAVNYLVERNLETIKNFLDTGAYEVLYDSHDGLETFKRLIRDREPKDFRTVLQEAKNLSNPDSIRYVEGLRNIAHDYAVERGLSENQFKEVWSDFFLTNEHDSVGSAVHSRSNYILQKIDEYSVKYSTKNYTKALQEQRNKIMDVVEKYSVFKKATAKVPYLKDINKESPGIIPVELFSEFEKFGRSSLYNSLLERGYREGEAMAEVINTHFDYTAKPDLVSKLELLIPFLQFPLENIKYWARQIDKNPAYIKNVLRLYNLNYNMSERTEYEKQNNHALMYNFNAGNILLGSGKSGQKDYTLKINNSMFDALSLVANPLGSLKDRLAVPTSLEPNEIISALPMGSKATSYFNQAKNFVEEGPNPATLWRGMFGEVYNYRTYTPYEQREGYWYDKNTGTWKKLYTKGSVKRIRYRKIYPRTSSSPLVIKSKITQDLNNLKNGLRYKLRKPAYDLAYKKVWR